GLWARGVLLRARLVIVGVPPVLARLPHVSFSIQETIGARAGRPYSDRVIALLTPVAPEHRALGARRLASPGEHAAVGSARRLLPFGLGRKPAARPLTIGPCLVPPDERHREIVMDPPIGVRWKRTSRGGRKALGAPDPHRELGPEDR